MYQNNDLFGLRQWARKAVENLKIKVKETYQLYQC